MARNQPKAATASAAHKEPAVEQIASFVGFFIYLLVLKSFFLPLFVIPTGSMAETLYGKHAVHTCPNCGKEYPVGMPVEIPVIRCPNCRWQEFTESATLLPRWQALGVKVDGVIAEPLRERGGDRIMVHGWTYDADKGFGPNRWDVVVFKVPSDASTNYIKRLIGKPGETIEVIDGDVYVAGPGGEPAITHKPREVQQSLWFPYYDQDHLPLQPSQASDFHPRWVKVGNGDGWQGLTTRSPTFDGGDESRIVFVTNPGPTTAPGLVSDIYGYDPAYRPSAIMRGKLDPFEQHVVTDVRLSSRVDFAGTDAPDAFLELSSTKHGETFFGRIYADGRLTLEHATGRHDSRELWSSAHVPRAAFPLVFALSNLDYVVSLEVDGKVLVQSTPEQYHADAKRRRGRRAATPRPPRLVITASGGRLALSRLLIERDVYYTSDLGVGRTGFGTQGHPITLGPNDYFVMGDNSPSSLDARFSFAQLPDEPLLESSIRADYQRGTVPGDQLIGPAFLVYWPGMAELLPERWMNGPLRLFNILPTPGRIRWIR